jgi:hypothetical protein
MRTPFKTILTAALLSLTAFVSVAYLSCNRDKCKTIVCSNGGVCNGGSCTCVLGYEGPDCSTRSRDKFIGIWNVTEKGSASTVKQYQTTIDSGVNITDIIIKNCYNYFTVNVNASVSGDTMFIYPQNYQGKYIDGIGVVTSNATYGQFDFMYVTYEVIDSVTGRTDDYGLNFGDGSVSSSWNK